MSETLTHLPEHESGCTCAPCHRVWLDSKLERATLRIGQVRIDTDGSLLIVGRHAPGLPDHRVVRYAATGVRLGVLLSDDFLATLPVWQAPADQVMTARIERARQDARIAQLTGEMVTEGWDRATATAIAREFARAGA